MHGFNFKDKYCDGYNGAYDKAETNVGGGTSAFDIMSQVSNIVPFYPSYGPQPYAGPYVNAKVQVYSDSALTNLLGATGLPGSTGLDLNSFPSSTTTVYIVTTPIAYNPSVNGDNRYTTLGLNVTTAGPPTTNQILDLDFGDQTKVFNDVAGSSAAQTGQEIAFVDDSSGFGNDFDWSLDTGDGWTYDKSSTPYKGTRNTLNHLSAKFISNFNPTSLGAISWYFVIERTSSEDSFDHLLHMGDDYGWDEGYGIQMSSSENLMAWLGDESSIASTGAQASHPTGTTLNTIQVVAAVFDVANKTVKLSLDAGTVYSDSFTGTYNRPSNTTAECVIGSSLNSSGTGIAFSADVSIYRVLAYNTAHSNTEMTNIATTLGNIY